MGRFTWFLVGTAVGSIQVLNYVYEKELLKQNLKNEIRIVHRMKDFVSLLQIKALILEIYLEYRLLNKWWSSEREVITRAQVVN